MCIGVIDTSAPYGYSPRREERQSSPRRMQQQVDESDRVSKDNFHLAQRIYKIMESPGMITDLINDTRHLDAHPGTMNYKSRLEEAQKIHNRNMAMATRLDNIKPFYAKSDLTLQVHLRRKNDKKNKKSNQKRNKIEYHIHNALVEIHGPGNITHRSEGNGYSNHQEDDMYQTNSARRAEPDETSRNVILEHTKVQDGRVLELAVIKEPYQDQYSVYGIDVDNGQKYELKLTSEDVASILDGDILVTSVDNVMVWLMLLNKCKLYPVDSFSRGQKRRNDVYSPEDEYQEFNDPFEDAEDPSNLEDKTLGEMDESFFFPAAPKASRPSTSGGRAGRQRGGRGTAGSKKERSGYTAEQGLFGLGETSGSDLKSSNQSPNKDDFADNSFIDEVNEDSVIKIQSKIRSSLAKKKVDLLKKEKEEQEVAAVRLQSKVRTSFAKKKVDLIKKEKYAADRAQSAQKREKEEQEKQTKQEQEAAIRLQAITRRKLSVRKVEILKQEKLSSNKVTDVTTQLKPSSAQNIDNEEQEKQTKQEQEAAIRLQAITRRKLSVRKVEILKQEKLSSKKVNTEIRESIEEQEKPLENVEPSKQVVSSASSQKQALKPMPPTSGRTQNSSKNVAKPSSVRSAPTRNIQASDKSSNKIVKGSAPAPIQEKPKLPAPEKYLRPNISKKVEVATSSVSSKKTNNVNNQNKKAPIVVKSQIKKEEKEVKAIKFQIGDIIECNYKSIGKWYSGQISAINEKGTYDVKYNDGDEERDVVEDLIRKIPKLEVQEEEVLDSELNISLKVGDKCEANYHSNGTWFSGSISLVRGNGTYDIKYDDGDSETGVRGNCIRLKEIVEVANDEVIDNTNISLKEGDKVEVNYKGRGTWCSGNISSVREDGTYDIKYDDGDAESNVKGNYIRLMEVVDDADEAEIEIDDNNNSKNDSKVLDNTTIADNKIDNKNENTSKADINIVNNTNDADINTVNDTNDADTKIKDDNIIEELENK